MSDEVVYHNAPKTEEPCETTTTTVKTEPEAVEQSDRGLFDFMGKKKEEEKCDDAVISSEFEQKVQVSEPEPKSEEKKESFLEKLHRSDSSSSSSSDEECKDGEKKKKKKPLKEKVKEKIEEHKEEEKIEKHEADTCVPIEKYEDAPVPPSYTEAAHPAPTPVPEEKKGFMEKIKEKLPGGHKKAEEEHAAVAAPPPPSPAVVTHEVESEQKEKKGILEKIKEKIPGYHSKSEEEKEKEKVKECD